MNFFNVMPFNGNFDISESEIRWQVFTSLALGASGVLYFCYWTPQGDAPSFLAGNAIMMPRLADTGLVYQPGPHYYQARTRIADTALAFRPHCFAEPVLLAALD